MTAASFFIRNQYFHYFRHQKWQLFRSSGTKVKTTTAIAIFCTLSWLLNRLIVFDFIEYCVYKVFYTKLSQNFSLLYSQFVSRHKHKTSANFITKDLIQSCDIFFFVTKKEETKVIVLSQNVIVNILVEHNLVSERVYWNKCRTVLSGQKYMQRLFSEKSSYNEHESMVKSKTHTHTPK